MNIPLLQEIVNKRRTFAIISHPDAGKTTLTEKLLLFGGAIREAGSIKGRKAQRHATSDWMEIEKQRGISVTSSVMQFKYDDHYVNILDTPGHQDFSEDTYRTLTAVDSAVMLIDIAKGVEPQTIKLFKVCRMRGIPIFTFINKMDRHGKDPLEVLQEIEEVLDIHSYPMNWPIGLGSDFKGVYDRHKKQCLWFDKQDKVKQTKGELVSKEALHEKLGESQYTQFMEEIDLLDIAGDDYNETDILQGKLTPVFFGSAITGFGVETFLQQFLELAPAPQPRTSSVGKIDPVNDPFSGFVFKIQANMNPAHRDRLAFIRVCSGQFERGMSVRHQRLGKQLKLSQSQQFLAQDRDTVDAAYPGDIIGLYDPGHFQIGDTITTDRNFSFDAIPTFPPEIFAKVSMKDAMRHKQFEKGLHQLIQEGAIQLYRTFIHGLQDYIIGAVGELQFEVFEYRLKQEYGVDIILQRMPYTYARWLPGKDERAYDNRILKSAQHIAVKDPQGRLVLLFVSSFALNWFEDNHSDISLSTHPQSE